MHARIAQAQVGDLDEVLALLGRVGLPIEGVAENFAHFLVARDQERLVGCVGMERYGPVALLRSLAVTPELQRSGLGRRLTRQLLEGMRAKGVQEVVLLTTTAADFFTRHFGFTPVKRSQYDEVLAASSEWHLTCCSSAACLRLRLDG